MFSSRNFLIRGATKSLVNQVCLRSLCTFGPPVIRMGDCLPHCDLYEDFPNNTIQMHEFAKGKNLVIFGVNGAFAPTCTKTHLAAFLKVAPTMKKDGIHEIICLSVNDAYVMGAWAKACKTKGKIRMFADPTGTFTYYMGLGMNMATLGGYRAMRFTMVVVDNCVKEIHVERDGVSFSCTLPDYLCYKKYLKTEGMKS